MSLTFGTHTLIPSSSKISLNHIHPLFKRINWIKIQIWSPLTGTTNLSWMQKAAIAHKMFSGISKIYIDSINLDIILMWRNSFNWSLRFHQPMCYTDTDWKKVFARILAFKEKDSGKYLPFFRNTFIFDIIFNSWWKIAKYLRNEKMQQTLHITEIFISTFSFQTRSLWTKFYLRWIQSLSFCISKVFQNKKN